MPRASVGLGVSTHRGPDHANGIIITFRKADISDPRQLTLEVQPVLLSFYGKNLKEQETNAEGYLD
jgi:hypothetical protein